MTFYRVRQKGPFTEVFGEESGVFARFLFDKHGNLLDTSCPAPSDDVIFAAWDATITVAA